MNEDTHYWLTRVAVKLNELFLSRVDFTLHDGQWLFDWNDELSLEKNLDKVRAEDKALTIFTQKGVIKSTRKRNFYREQQLESFADPLRGHLIFGNWEEFDAPKREYEYLRYVDDVNWDKFIDFCEEYDLNYKQDGILATLEITNQAPVINIGNDTYILKTLQSGSTYDIIQVAYDHIDIRFGLSELRKWSNKSFTAQKRFTDIFRTGKNEFSKNSVLSPFADITAQTFMLKKNAQLSPTQIKNIQESSTN